MVLARELSGQVDDILLYIPQLTKAACLKLSKAIQRTSETLQSVGDLYDDHVSRILHSK